MNRQKEKRRRCRLLLLPGLMLLALGTTACATSGGDSSTAKPKPRIKVSVYDRVNVPSSEGSIVNNKITRWINEAGPVDVEFVPVLRTQSEQKLNGLFAAGEAPDLIMEYAPQIKNTLIDQGLLRPVDDMIEQYSTTYKERLQRYPILRKAGTGEDGRLYQFGRINETVPMRAAFIRTDWLERLQLDIPQTTEELFQVAKAFTEQDPDGNGKRDTYGIALAGTPGVVIDEMFGLIYPDYVVRDGELVHGWDNIEAVTAFKKRVYDEGLADREFWNDKNGYRARQDFLRGRIGIYLDQFNVPTAFYNDFYVRLKRNVPDARLTVIPYPVTPVGQFNPVFVNPVQMTGVVNAATRNPKAVMQYVDFAVSEQFMKTMYFGFAGIHHTVAPNGCPKLIGMEKWRTEFNYGVGDFGMLTSPTLAGRCYFGTEKLDEKEPLQREVQKMFELNSSYVNFALETAGPTHAEQMPRLPQDLQGIVNQLTGVVGTDGDLWLKAILTPNYSPEEARKEAEALWEQAGGKKVDEWYRNFYAHDRDQAIMTKDIYQLFREQRATRGK
ncbi:extracellular solute-binding protein [Paenibacillus whitsoniae]|uniref:Extracellular solute-binding protein n=1 Tax=Paenibacillus whitsoniae TaxID=2496558 RepID=A0A430JCJ6_9BACL|nr:extracellular solute-binding protein [Paenibacillus whitsoniae]RTE08758.1 extracellular solute-binding protein [Paenibacillus whitsoniae]